ncbi:UDP-N-acetylmuramate dehydrogenase [Nocardia altamirensis]|uniref:UDP-N-acetylmuramate dehydrogenase n=1 Tax=Nocardia altamirensis TaxID=472158 RepID=UPI003F7740D3
MATMIADLTTMRLGGPAAEFAKAASTDELITAIRDADAAGQPVLVVGGGSNLVVGDDGFDGLVVQVATPGLRIDGDHVVADAGVEWDDLVVATLDAGLAGLEPLSGIPGSVGGTPVQNVGAYGTLTSDFLETVSVYDRVSGAVEVWGPDRCGFGSHRQSTFKHTRRYVVLSVSFRLAEGHSSLPIAYDALAQRLGVAANSTAKTSDVRAAVLALRGERGMLLDEADHDTWSVGSFFINPVLSEVPAQAAACPQYPDPNGVKLSAAWLIHRAGFAPGYGRDRDNGTVALSSKHALAVTNRGGATTADVMRFAAHIRDGVEAAFGVRLGPECDLVNCAFG